MPDAVLRSKAAAWMASKRESEATCDEVLPLLDRRWPVHGVDRVPAVGFSVSDGLG
jgi:hypothetical protein